MNGSEKLYSLCSPRHFLLVSFSIFFSIFPFIPYISPRRFPKHAQAMKRLRFAGKALGKCASDITFFLFSKWKMFLDAEFFANNLWPQLNWNHLSLRTIFSPADSSSNHIALVLKLANVPVARPKTDCLPFVGLEIMKLLVLRLSTIIFF